MLLSPWIAIASLLASAPPANSSLFEKLRVLEGEWEAMNASGKKITVRYRSISNDSVLVQSFSTASGKETMTVIHADGPELIATHYCGQGNQPRLRLQSVSAKNDDFVFTFYDATNLAPAAAHLTKLELKLEDAMHYTEIETYEENGKPDVTTLRFTRTAKSPVPM